VGKEVIRRGIPHDTACDQLVQLIKEYGRWVEPAEKEEQGAQGGNKELVGSA